MNRPPLPNPIFKTGENLIIVTLRDGDAASIVEYGRKEYIIPPSVSVGQVHGQAPFVTESGQLLFPLIVRPFGGPLTLFAPQEQVLALEAFDGARVAVVRGYTAKRVPGSCMLLVQEHGAFRFYDSLAEDIRRHGVAAAYTCLSMMDQRMRLVVRTFSETDLTL